MREQRLRLHAVFFRRRGESGKVHVCGEVLLARSFVGIGRGGVLTICHQRPAMAAGELFLTGVAVVDRDDHTLAHGRSQARHVTVRQQWNFDALSWLGMHSVAIEKRQFFRGWRNPGLDETAVLRGDAERSLLAENLHRKGVEEFVGENDDGNLSARARSFIALSGAAEVVPSPVFSALA